MRSLISILVILLLCIAPISAEKNKGLFSGDILQADLDAFTANTSDTPSYTDEGTPEQTNLQNISEWVGIGKTHLRSGNWASAEEAFSQVTQLDPKYNDGWEGYLLAIRGGGDFYKLLTAAEDAAEKDPGFVSIWKYKGIALSGIDKPEEALAALDKALEVDPAYYQAWYYKGIAYDSLKRYDEAVRAYDQVIKVNPDYAKAWNNKGVSLLYLQRYDEAITALEMAVAIDPSYSAAMSNKNLAVDEKKKSSLGSVDIIDDSSLFVPSSTPSPITAVITLQPTVVSTPIPIPVQTPVITPAPVTPTVVPTPVFQATLSASVVAKGDKMFIRGTAEGDPSKGIAIWILGKNKVLYATESVNDDMSFEHEVKNAATASLNAGQYFVVVQHPMYNNEFDIYPDNALDPQKILAAHPTRDSEVFRIGDAGALQGTDAAEALVRAIDSAIVDDIYTKMEFLVEEPKVTINPIGEQAVGSKFEITGTSNLMYDDNYLTIEVTSSSFKPTDKSQSGEFNGAYGQVKVQQGTDGLNKWSFTVDASTFKPDEYIVIVSGVTTDVVETALFNVI